MQITEPSTAKPTVPDGLRRFLYFTAALNGAAILIVEILGAKILAPYIGTSHFVWTAQISVTLLSLAVGYYLGGNWVGRTQSLRGLYLATLAAALYLCLTILLSSKVAYACLDLGIKWGSILASGFLFFVPLTLLAMTGPFLIHVLTSSVRTVGGQAGRVSAVSTLGSVLGAALIGFVLIPFLPNSIIMLITAGCLVLVSLVYLLAFNEAKSGKAMVLMGTVLCCGSGYAAFRQDSQSDFVRSVQLCRRNSNFGLLQVIQIKGHDQVLYVNDYLTQNVYFTNSHQSGAGFTYMLHALAKAYTPSIKSALCIGMGVGIVPTELAKEGIKVDVVEINETVIPVAQQFFDLDVSRFQLFLDDGRHYLNRTTNRYDALILDAFLGDSSPSHLMTQEAFTSMRAVLQPEGTLVINCFGYFEYGRDYFVASLEKTLQSVFRNVRIHDSGRGNVYIAASNREEMTFHPPNDLEYVHPSVVADVRKALVNVVASNPAHGRVLTDDYNPVEFYDMINRERFRKNMALQIRSL